MSNTITVTGNLVGEPELRFMANGQATASFSIADNKRWQDKQGNWHDQASFFDVVAWREMAENITESLAKGDRVIITGQLEQRTFEYEDGRKGSKIQIRAEEIAPSLRWSTCEVRKNERRAPAAGAAPSGAGTDTDDEQPF